jgi:hypothetical protein
MIDLPELNEDALQSCQDDPAKWARLFNDWYEDDAHIDYMTILGWFTEAIERSNKIRSDREMQFAEDLSIVALTKNPIRPSSRDTLESYLLRLLPLSFRSVSFHCNHYLVELANGNSTLKEIIYNNNCPFKWADHDVIYRRGAEFLPITKESLFYYKI